MLHLHLSYAFFLYAICFAVLCVFALFIPDAAYESFLDWLKRVNDMYGESEKIKLDKKGKVIEVTFSQN